MLGKYKYKEHQRFRINNNDVFDGKRKDTKKLRENVSNDVETYLANGGTVETVPGFESTYDPKALEHRAMSGVS